MALVSVHLHTNVEKERILLIQATKLRRADQSIGELIDAGNSDHRYELFLLMW